MKSHYGVLCLLIIIGTGLPAACADDLLEVFGQPDEYDYDTTVDEVEEPVQSSQVVPAFNVQPLDLTPLLGDTVSFPCTSDKNQSEVLLLERYSFSDPPQKMLISAGELFLVTDKRYSISNNVFTIRNVKRSDSAHYKCMYQYDGERISVTHSIKVYYEPSIRSKQSTIEVVMGDSASLNCVSNGNPTPKITWRKQDGRMPSGVEEQEGIEITFINVDRHVGGSYVCTADNGVGTAATGLREIIVSYAPEIRTENEIIHTGNGDRVELVCVVHAFPAAEVSWSRDGYPVDSDTRAEVHEGGHRHLLTIEKVAEQDFGVYTCKATNSLGSDEEFINITDAPSAPAIISDPHSAEEASYTLAWSTQSYYPITHYELLYRKIKANDSSDEPGEWHELNVEPEAANQETIGIARTFRHTLEDLERATDYEAILRVANSVKPAQEIKFTFSTRKETAGQQQTNAGHSTTISLSCLMMLLSSTSVALARSS